MPMPGPSAGRGLEMPEGDEGNNMNMESSLAATVEAQGKQLLEQQQRIRELEKRLDSLAGKVVAVEGDDNNCNEVAAPVQVGGVHVSEVPKENNEFNSAALYEFDQSMWDAALLLFFRKGSNWVEKLILVIGCGINYFLQLSLLLTISVNMLDTPYSPATIQEMLAWRVEQAQANSQFDNVRGKSLATRLCNQELWTYEQEEYKLMYAYLYKDIPGSLLSTLGIIMWVLTIMREYRRSMEQALAVIHLPALEEGKKSEFEWDREAEEWTVVGMNRVKRILALVLLSLPRLGVTVCLGLIGCQYLAQTANLADIVLNAVALAFVMDVDELVADVLLTERLRSILPKIKPLSCGVRKRGRCCPFKDIVRYALTTGFVAFALIYWLMPFEQNVRGAAMALCGGYQDFSYEGGTAESPPIILKPASWSQDSFVSSCDADEGETLNSYLSRYYEGARYNDSVHNLSASSATAEYYAGLQQQHVLQFAYARYQSFGGMFSSCAQGEILGPQDPESGERSCIPVPKRLEEELQFRRVVHGHSQPEAPEDCLRMNPANGCDEYMGVLPGTSPACIWTWLAEKCDGNPPGNVNVEACGAESDILLRCQTWQSVLGRTDPKYNCNRIIDYHDWGLCAPPYDCVGFQGQYRVEPTNMTAGLTSAFKSVLMSQSSLSEQKISIHTEQIGPRKLLVRVCMFNLPPDYKPLPDLRTSMDWLLSLIQAQPNYFPETGIVSIETVPGTIYYTPTYDLQQDQVAICEGGTTFVPGPV
mmetsp:Transcript_55362/g.132233  ORF Transcript_55362/g.132233 Transcript_55362/m.132233 type:complete len:760 (-) Transcript_55362:313-2592(-)